MTLGAYVPCHGSSTKERCGTSGSSYLPNQAIHNHAFSFVRGEIAPRHAHATQNLFLGVVLGTTAKVLGRGSLECGT